MSNNYDLYDAISGRGESDHRSAPAPASAIPPLDPKRALPETDPAPGYTANLPVRHRRRWWQWLPRIFGGLILLFFIAVAWLAITAPLSKSLQPPAPPSITLLADDGTPIARRGAVIGAPVDAAKLPAHVRQAFIAIEDRRFYQHWGVDPRGIARAFAHNIFSRGGAQGGSTITQQLAKNAFLDSRRTASRKLQEVMIAFWLETWLTKDQILSRYLSNVYFGDNVYGLRAAARHYFSRDPEDLSVSQAAMLAGLVQAPSRLAPTGNLKGARDRQKLVVAAMRDVGFLTKVEAAAAGPAVLHPDRVRELPNGTYFADWVLPQARDRAGEIVTEQTVRTTLDARLQKAAERAVRSTGLAGAQVALVAMHADGQVVAMVGGKSYKDSPFNRATQAQRQPGSTFKLFVYLAALRSGMTPDSMVDDSPVQIGDWKPTNSDGHYRGEIPLRQAFAVSSNVAAARLTQKVGPGAVIRAARDLGISTPIPNEASIALGTANVSLLELTSAYAAVANGEAPVRPRGLPEPEKDSWLATIGGRTRPLGESELDGLRDLLQATIHGGTATTAALSVPAYGKTGTTQDNRDVWFVGYAGDLVVGVWVGNDDNSPNAHLRSTIPARIWRNFMIDALGVSRPEEVAPPAIEDNVADEAEDPSDADAPGPAFEGNISGLGFNLRVGRDGGLSITGPGAPDAGPPPPRRSRRDDTRPPPDASDEQ